MRFLLVWALVGAGCGDDMPPAPTGPTVLATALANPVALALDADFVYVANSGDGSIVKVRKDGGGVQTLAVTQPGLAGIAVDAQAVYVTNKMQGTVSKIPGGAIATGLDHPSAIVAAPSGIYWINSGSAGAPPGTVMAILSSGARVTIATAMSATFPGAITVDDAHVYWVNGRDGSIGKSDLSGGAVQELRAPGGEFFSVDIALTNGRLYLAGVNFGLGWISVDGGPLTMEVPAATNGGYAHVSIAGSQIYVLWNALPPGSAPDVIWAYPDRQLVGNLPVSLALAVDDKFVYWTEAGTGSSNGALLKMPR